MDLHKMFYVSLIFTCISVLLCLLIFYKRRSSVFGWLNHVFYPHSLRPLSWGIFLPSERDEKLEEGKHTLQQGNDTMVFLGVGSPGNKVILKITHFQNGTCELLIVLNLANGAEYTKTCETSKTSGKWNAGCLLFESVEPMRIWRISFNGLLRSTDKVDCHVRINLIWRAFSQPHLYKNHEHEQSCADSLLELEDGFEQWGALVGTIQVGSNSTGDLHFMSQRQRYWGNKNWSNITGFSEDGTMFSIGVSCETRNNFCHVRFPKGHTSLFNCNCPEFASLSSVPDNLELSLSGKIDHSVKVTCNHTINFSSRNLFLSYFNGYFDSVTVEGFLQVWDSVIIEDLTLPAVEEVKKKVSEVFFLPLDSPLCTDSTLVGGKGASLAVLTALENTTCSKLNAAVPKGICLTKVAMELQIQSSRELKAAIRTLIQDAHSLDLSQTCQSIQEVWLSTKVCTEIQYVLSKQIASYFPYAVRSSGLSEDTSTLSSAGQNATYLGCVGLESILLAIQKCWASLYSFQSVQYRRLHGIPLRSSMGIVIQKMVAAEISGAMFTCDPVTGNPFEVLISANYGLGETVVSASVEPDSIKLQCNSDSSGNTEFKIVSQEIGKKTHQISMIGNGLIVKLNLDDCSANEICMSHDEAKLLGKIGKFVEKQFGCPCDIEWAILKGVVYLLQCRPVTTLHAWSDNELFHEFDSALLLKDVTTTANAGEVLPGATSILSQSLLVKALDVSISFQANERLNIDDLYNNMNCITSGHHVFIHVLNSLLIKIEKNRTPAQTATELAVCGHIIIDENIQKLAVHRNGVINNWIKLKLTFNILNNMWWCNLVTKEAEEDAVNFSIPFKDCLSAKELFELLDKNLFQLEKVARRHSFVTTVNVSWQVILLVVLLEGEKDLSNDHFKDICQLLQGCSSVISAEIPSDLEDIAKKISQCDNSDEFYNIPTNFAKHWMKVHCPEAAHLLSKFLIYHGHRSIRELDLYTETWGLNASPLLANLQNLVRGNSRKQEKISVPDELNEVIKKLSTPKKSSTRRALKFIIPFCNKTTEQREVTKNSLLLVIHAFRVAFNQLGNLMARENYLPQPKLIFFCTFYEIKKLLLSREPVVLHKALRRQRLWEQWDCLKFSEIITGLPQPIATDTINQIDDKTCIKGTLVYPGRAEGRACVVLDVSESLKVNPGDILITNSTDVGWSPLFPLLSGIVTELGGLISHGAVVAREYGVPCLIGATSATSVFKTGDKVVLDGASSSIYKLIE